MTNFAHQKRTAIKGIQDSAKETLCEGQNSEIFKLKQIYKEKKNHLYICSQWLEISKASSERKISPGLH